MSTSSESKGKDMEKKESAAAAVVEKDKSPTAAELVALPYVIEPRYNEKYLASIEYVRVGALEGFVETTTEEKEKEVLIFGEVLFKDFKGSEIIFYRPRCRPNRVLLSSSTAAAAAGSGTTDYYLPLYNPSRPIIPTFSCPFWVTFDLWVKLSDDRDQRIVQGMFLCHPPIEGVETGKLLERVMGPVTTGFSIIESAICATIHDVTITTTPHHDDDDDESLPPPPPPQQIYGTIKAFRFLKSGDSSPSPLPLLLFDRSPDQSLQLNHPGRQSIPLTRTLFPVPVDSVLTITVHLWNHHDNQQIAEGSLHFTPVHDAGRQYKTLTHTINTTDGGEVQASVSFNF